MAECIFVKRYTNYRQFLTDASYFVQLQSITDNQIVPKDPLISQSFDTGKNTNKLVLTMNKVVAFLPLFKEAKLILTAFCGNQKQTLKDLLLTIRDLVQFTLCLLIHGGIVSIFPRIRLLKVNIIILLQIRIAIVGMENIPS